MTDITQTTACTTANVAMTISKICPRVDILAENDTVNFVDTIGGGVCGSGTDGSGPFYGPSLGAGGFTGLIVGFSGGSTFGSGGLSICGIQEYFKNSSEVTSGFSNPSKPISMVPGVNSSTLVTKPGPYLNPF